MTRVALGLLLASLLVAGCLQSGTTPTPSSPATSTPPVVTHPGGGAAVRPAHAENSTAGFRFVGDESVSLIVAPGNVTFSFVATNEGDNASALLDPCGEGNPRVAIFDANGTRLDLTGPVAHCMALAGFVSYAHGETIARNVTWDGLAWNGEKRAPVAPGQYEARATLVVKRGEAPLEIEVRLPFGVTENRGAL